MKGIKQMKLSNQELRDLADRVAVASVNEIIPLGGFASKLCDAYCHADSGNRAKILAGFSDDFIAWHTQWNDYL